MNLPPEHQLMLYLTDESVSREGILEILVRDSISFNTLLQVIHQSGVAPLIWDLIHRHQLEDIFPPVFIQNLSQIHRQTAFFNLLLLEETRKVIEDLNRKGIPVILFKGSSLIQEIYLNMALRPCSDVDLLIERDSFAEVKKSFLDNGFFLPETLMNESFYFRHHFHIPFIKPLRNTPVEVEVHWHLMDKYLLKALRLDEIWNQKKPLNFEGTPTFALSPEHELIYLPLHIQKHGYMNSYIASNPALSHFLFDPIAENKLIWFIDLKKIIEKRGPEIDWKQFYATSTHWGVYESIRPIFMLLKNLYPALEIPANIVNPGQSIPMTFFKKYLFNVLLTKSHSSFVRKHFLTMKGDLQFRLIRVFDILEFLCPKFSILSRLYRFKNPLPALFYYPYHFIKTLFLAVLGFVEWQLFNLKHVFHRKAQNNPS